jgi:hypothetical protein
MVTENARNDYQVCVHLLEAEEVEDYYQYFTGVGKSYYLVCEACSKESESIPGALRAVEQAAFEKVETMGYASGFVGRPEVRFEPAGLVFEHRWVDFPELQADPLRIVRPLPGVTGSLWIGVTASGALVRIDCNTPAVTVVVPQLGEELDFTAALELEISPDGAWAAVANTLMSHGVVVELSSGRRTMVLVRDDYHEDVSPYPLAFGRQRGRVVLAHGTEWNRLDVSDPATGELLTVRKSPEYVSQQPAPEHYLDYFHGRLTLSPDQRWVVDDGWIWHPVGNIVIWDFQRWLEENVWESEDGSSRKALDYIPYFWDVPKCWIDARRLAIWGYGNDDEWMIPAARVIDAEAGKLVDWFPGPEIALREGTNWKEAFERPSAFFFDRYLFAVSERYGIGVWDVERGVCMLQEASFAPEAYHPEAREFVTVLPEGRLQLSRLIG